MKGLTGRKRGGKMGRILEELARLLTGWLGYYSIANLKAHLKRISGRLRRRIRQIQTLIPNHRTAVYETVRSAIEKTKFPRGWLPN
ncbi:MAG: hypothetical protein LBD47_07850 [Treponema sp.]|nr:hypothetical protein [Treponema sp.]